MIPRIIRTSLLAERDDSQHVARLMLILRHLAEKGDGTVAGITKLAKLDFLCRYPQYFQRFSDRVRSRPEVVELRPYENLTVENRMIRFRYGPWDPRYRRWISLLVSRGLAHAYTKGRTVHVGLTPGGVAVSEALASWDEFRDLDIRAEQLSRIAASKSGTQIKDIIYEIVPELGDLDWGERI